LYKEDISKNASTQNFFWKSWQLKFSSPRASLKLIIPENSAAFIFLTFLNIKNFLKINFNYKSFALRFALVSARVSSFHFIA